MIVHRIVMMLPAVFFAGAQVIAQADMDFHPRMLYRDLGRPGPSSSVELREISIHGGKADHIPGKYFLIDDNGTGPDYRYVYMGRVNSCRSGGCSSSITTAGDLSGEYFDYFILFDAAGAVQLVRIYNYQATHGQEVTAAAWLKQFIGYSGKENLNVGKNIDAISGATISVTGMAADVEEKTRLLLQWLER